MWFVAMVANHLPSFTVKVGVGGFPKRKAVLQFLSSFIGGRNFLPSYIGVCGLEIDGFHWKKWSQGTPIYFYVILSKSSLPSNSSFHEGSGRLSFGDFPVHFLEKDGKGGKVGVGGAWTTGLNTTLTT